MKLRLGVALALCWLVTAGQALAQAESMACKAAQNTAAMRECEIERLRRNAG